MAMTTTMSVIKLIPRYVRKVAGWLAGWLTVWLVAIDVIHYKVNNNNARQHLVSKPAAATAPTVVDENKIF